MKYKRFGNTGMLVSEICLGAMTFGAGRTGIWSSIGQLNQETVNELVKRSLEAGVNFFDTANVYSDGESEKLLGQTFHDLKTKRDEIIIATKVSGMVGQGPNGSGLSRQHIFNQVKASLKRLQIDYIDLYQIHSFDPVTPLEETLLALNDLVRTGLVRYIGCSNLTAWQIMKARGITDKLNIAHFESVQSYYTIAGRDIEREIVPLLNDQQMGLMVWSPLAGGLLSGKFKKEKKGPEGSRRTAFDFPPVDLERAYKVINEMETIANLRKISVARVALAWLLAKQHVTTVIIGAKNLQQLNENLDSVTIELTAEELAKLDEVSKLPSEYPGWMQTWQQSNSRLTKYLQ